MGSSLRSALWVLCLAAQLGLPARAQEATLVVRSNDPEAVVFADTTWLGAVSQSPFDMAPGSYRVRVAPGGPGAWGRAPIERDVLLEAGDTVTVHGHFQRVYYLEADPEAQVALVEGDSIRALGRTPVLFEAPSVPRGVFRLSADGFGAVDILPGRAFWNRQFVELERVEAAGHLVIARTDPSPPRRWIDYAAVGVSLAAGIVAVHYKRKADRRFDVYRETGDPDLRPLIRRYDTYSGVAVGTMQAGLTLFTIRLIRR